MKRVRQLVFFNNPRPLGMGSNEYSCTTLRAVNDGAFVTDSKIRYRQYNFWRLDLKLFTPAQRGSGAAHVRRHQCGDNVRDPQLSVPSAAQNMWYNLTYFKKSSAYPPVARTKAGTFWSEVDSINHEPLSSTKRPPYKRDTLKRSLYA
ncbi:hypothetical protein EVAR_84851_1 [Eumeta japonica]|uniref:Uncharacterized protein n=1 Tax=Eumeta variegata TaxID=151549 RepID=A0A4C1ZWJ9_EUMVA|nr:hypothetical protein EVAR_84851_1 [Eumeta japonica]